MCVTALLLVNCPEDYIENCTFNEDRTMVNCGIKHAVFICLEDDGQFWPTTVFYFSLQWFTLASIM